MPPSAGIRIGIDIGGTFTDLQVLDERSGALNSLKTPTTPEDPSIGLMTGIEEAGRRFGFGIADVHLLLHGTTIATNAVLERKLPHGVLLTTEGFRDVLEIGRHARRDVYGLKPHREPPLIARNRRLGVAERIRADGSVERALDPAAIDHAIAQIRALEAETVAITLLNASINPAHEQRLRDAVCAALPGLPVCISAEVSPEIREYERSSTTVLNALLMPVVQSYLAQLAARMASHGMTARLLLVQSNGGVCTAEVAGAQPVRLLLSGPSGGALAALRSAEKLGRPNLVGIDMGGTSFDVCVVQAGQVALMTQGEIDGLPVRLPMIEIRTIGAGGGSIAAVDSGGRLTVGPRSAGARPGPVCYGRGGTLPTVTDANLVLGRLDGAFFLGGAMALDTEAARAAIDTEVAQKLGLSIEAAASGILSVANVSLAAAVRLSLFEKGLDPRDFGLLSFGGAGGVHAIPVAEELGIDQVVFPPDASTFSAFGILQSDIVHDLARSRILRAEAARAAIDTEVAQKLGLSIEAAASGILSVANVSLAAAVRLSLFEKGLDPRDFGLLSFGGAGGVHAIPVAEELGIDQVVFPPDASTFSAFGILQSDIVHDLARSRILRAEAASLPDIAQACVELRRNGDALLARDGVPADNRVLSLLVDMRYHGQAFELVVPWGDVEPNEATLATLIADFHALHRQRFSYANLDDPVEIVTLRLAATGRLPRYATAPRAASGTGPVLPTRRVFIESAWVDVEIYRRPYLTTTISGPALIEEDYTSVYVAPGWRCGPGEHGDLLARKEAP